MTTEVLSYRDFPPFRLLMYIRDNGASCAYLLQSQFPIVRRKSTTVLDPGENVAGEVWAVSNVKQNGCNDADNVSTTREEAHVTTKYRTREPESASKMCTMIDKKFQNKQLRVKNMQGRLRGRSFRHSETRLKVCSFDDFFTQRSLSPGFLIPL